MEAVVRRHSKTQRTFLVRQETSMKRKSRKASGCKFPRDSSISEAEEFDRRSFVKLVPALTVAVATAPYLKIGPALGQTPAPTASPASSVTPSPQQEAALRVTKEMLRGAEQLFGIELTDAQKQMALQNVNRNLDAYETLRKIEVPLDTEPANWFRPALPGKKFNLKSSKFKLTRVELPPFGSVEDLAFATVTQLAELIRRRKVSPV